jgi:hypothetical protein
LDYEGAKRLMEAICVDFINSEFRDFRGRWMRDDLQQPGWLEQFLMKWGLQVDHPPEAAMLTTLASLRTFLRSMIETLVEGKITEQDQAALNAILFKMPLCRQLENDTNRYQSEIDLEMRSMLYQIGVGRINLSFLYLIVE